MGNESGRWILQYLGMENATTEEVLEAFEDTLRGRLRNLTSRLAAVLAHRGGADVERHILRMLTTPLDPGYREHHVAWIAGRLRIEAAVPALVRALPDPAVFGGHGQFVDAALAALAAIGTPEAEQALAGYYRGMAASPLRRLCRECQLTALRSLGRRPSPERVTAVLDLVRDPRFDPWNWDAVFHLVPVADERFAPFFVEMLAGACPEAGLAGLERVATSRAETALLGLLRQNPSRRVRHQVTRAMLRLYRPSRSVPLGLERSPDPEFRRVAAYLLGQVDPRHPGQHHSLLHDPDARVRGAAATSFGILADPGAARVLLPLLDDPSHDVRARTVTALAGIAIGGVAEDSIADDADIDAGTAVAEALPKLREMAAGDPVPCVRDAAASAIRRIGRQASDAS